VKNLRLGYLNSRSLANKADAVAQHIISEELDILVVVETWLKPRDEVVMDAATPSNYRSVRLDRKNKRGGGIAIIFRSTLRVVKILKHSVDNVMELLQLRFASTGTGGTAPFVICAVYRPPGSYVQFLDEFHDFVSHSELGTSTVIIGDFNFHLEDVDAPGVRSFISLLSLLGWQQQVAGPTHEAGHTLDLIITRTNSDIICSSMIKFSPGVADHMAITTQLTTPVHRNPVKYVQSRSMKKLKPENFWTDFWQEFLKTSPSEMQCSNDLIQHYNRVATLTLDRHAPLRRIRVTTQRQTPWYGGHLQKLKQSSHSCEKKWRETGIEIDRDLYKAARNTYVNSVKETKAAYLRNEVAKRANDSKALWSLLSNCTGDSLKMGRLKKSSLPTGLGGDEQLSELFGDFFTGKISTINRILGVNMANGLAPQRVAERVASTGHPDWSSFNMVSVATVQHLLKNLPSKRSSADTLPLVLVRQDKKVFELLTEIVNDSLDSGIFPCSLKRSIVTPVLKKIGLDAEVLSNFRPVSNLDLLSKIIENVVAQQLSRHLDSSSCLHPCQSAYRRFHSTETALLRVTSDWRHSLARKQMVCVISLDVSAAFDTVSHPCMIQKLTDAAVSGVPLAWFASYLRGRKVCYKVGASISKDFTMDCGVPQGSVLGPILFNLYMAPLAHLLTELGITLHIYADDVIVYISFDESDIIASFAKLQMGLDAIERWMVDNRLLLNSSKTRLHLLRRSGSLPPCCPSLSLQNVILTLVEAEELCWLGVNIDTSLSFASFVVSKCQSAYSQLRMIRYLRKSLDMSTTLLLVNSLVVSRLLYCDSLLVAVPDNLLNKVKRVWNLAARTVVAANRLDHITPILQRLGWPSARQRTRLKVARLAYLSLHGMAPAYLQCEKHVPSRSLRSGSQGAVQLQRVAASGVMEAGRWEVVAPELWNSLPPQLRRLQSSSVNQFLEEVTGFLGS
jgi:hypothetical protein